MPNTILQKAHAVLGTRRRDLPVGRAGVGSRKCANTSRSGDCVNNCSNCGNRQRFHCNCSIMINKHNIKSSIYCRKCFSNCNCLDSGCSWVGDRFHCNCSGGNSVRTTSGRSPRLGSGAGGKDVQQLLPFNTSKLSGSVLSDITNLTGKTDADKKSKDQAWNSQSTPATDTPAEANVQDVAEYLADISDHMFREEMEFLPRADYLDMQTEINGKMRGILNDWLVEVHLKYRLRDETLHLAVGLVDRYLSKAPVPRNRLQLVGVGAMFIAAKYEEIYPPGLQDFVYITDNAYTKEDVLMMECDMLTSLSFAIAVPTAAHFFPLLQKVNGGDGFQKHFAQYLMELGLLDVRLLQYRPSKAVSSALLLSNEIIGRTSAWPPEMARHSRHAEADLRGCVELLRQLYEEDRSGNAKLMAVHKKYSSTQRYNVANSCL